MVTKDGDGNMLREEVFQELRKLDNLIQNASVHYDGEFYSYVDICARWGEECFANDILNLDQVLGDVSFLLYIFFYLIFLFDSYLLSNLSIYM